MSLTSPAAPRLAAAAITCTAFVLPAALAFPSLAAWGDMRCRPCCGQPGIGLVRYRTRRTGVSMGGL